VIGPVVAAHRKINLANYTRFRTPDSPLGDTNFGRVTQTTGHPRNGQIAVRFEF
jgi:hypothetical protein